MLLSDHLLLLEYNISIQTQNLDLMKKPKMYEMKIGRTDRQANSVMVVMGTKLTINTDLEQLQKLCGKFSGRTGTRTNYGKDGEGPGKEEQGVGVIFR